MNIFQKSISLFIAVMTVFAAQAKNYEVASPSGDLRAVVSVTNSGTTLSVFAGETEVLAPSPISITIKENNESRTKVLWGMNSKQPKVRRSFVDEMIPAPVYKRFQVKDRYNQMVLSSGKQGLVVRAYDDGIAYRLTYKNNIPYTVYNEQADFTFPADYPMYASYVKRGDDGDFESQYINSFENTYEHESITKFKSSRLLFLPVLVELPHGMKVCITEADLDNYPGMYLVGGGDTPVLASHFAPCGLNVVDRPFSWRSTTAPQIGTPSPRELPTSCSPSALSARHLENSTTAKPASSAYFAISHYTLLYLAILCYILLYLEQRWLTCKQTLLSPQQVKHLPRLSAAKMCSKNSMRASSTGLVPRGA